MLLLKLVFLPLLLSVFMSSFTLFFLCFLFLLFLFLFSPSVSPFPFSFFLRLTRSNHRDFFLARINLLKTVKRGQLFRGSFHRYGPVCSKNPGHLGSIYNLHMIQV